MKLVEALVITLFNGPSNNWSYWAGSVNQFEQRAIKWDHTCRLRIFVVCVSLFTFGERRCQMLVRDDHHIHQHTIVHVTVQDKRPCTLHSDASRKADNTRITQRRIHYSNSIVAAVSNENVAICTTRTKPRGLLSSPTFDRADLLPVMDIIRPSFTWW